MADMQQTAPRGGQAGFHPVHLAEAALRSAEQVYDAHVSAARTLWQTQARAAAALGLPDWSSVLECTDERTRQVVSIATEQWLATAQQAHQAWADLSEQLVRTLEHQTAEAAETWQRGLQQWSSTARDGVNQWRDATRQATDAAQRQGDQAAAQWRDANQRAAQEAQERWHQGAEAARSATSEAASQAGAQTSALAEAAREATSGDGPGASRSMGSMGEAGSKAGERKAPRTS